MTCAHSQWRCVFGSVAARLIANAVGRTLPARSMDARDAHAKLSERCATLPRSIEHTSISRHDGPPRQTCRPFNQQCSFGRGYTRANIERVLTLADDRPRLGIHARLSSSRRTRSCLPRPVKELTPVFPDNLRPHLTPMASTISKADCMLQTM